MKNTDSAEDSKRFSVLPIGSLVPNAYTGNVMNEDCFEELKNEVWRLSRTPKPIVVRPLPKGRYDIVDGEHSWRAAAAVGLRQIDCEIVDVHLPRSNR